MADEWKVVAENSAKADPAGLEAKLNELSADGWTMFSVDFDPRQPWFKIVAFKPEKGKPASMGDEPFKTPKRTF